MKRPPGALAAPRRALGAPEARTPAAPRRAPGAPAAALGARALAARAAAAKALAARALVGRVLAARAPAARAAAGQGRGSPRPAAFRPLGLLASLRRRVPPTASPSLAGRALRRRCRSRSTTPTDRKSVVEGDRAGVGGLTITLDISHMT